MRENDLLAPRRVGSPRGPRNHDGTIIPETVDTMWGTDLTTTFTGEGPAAVFIAVDHCSAECVGIHSHSRATRFDALEPIRQGVRQYFGGFAKGIARGLTVRHDHGSQYMSDHFQKEIAFLGIERFARLRPRARGKRLCRTVHPHSQGKPALGAHLRDDRGTASGSARLPRHLQHDLADRTTRLDPPRPFPAEPPSRQQTGAIGFNPPSQKSRAVHQSDREGKSARLTVIAPWRTHSAHHRQAWHAN